VGPLEHIGVNVAQHKYSSTTTSEIPNWDVIAPILIGLWVAFIVAMIGYAGVTMALDYWLLSQPEPVFR
jgi:hypothetical protein